MVTSNRDKRKHTDFHLSVTFVANSVMLPGKESRQTVNKKKEGTKAEQKNEREKKKNAKTKTKSQEETKKIKKDREHKQKQQ